MTGADLRAWREAHRLTQAQLADLLGVDVMTVSRWERGVRAIPPLLPRALRDIERATGAQ